MAEINRDGDIKSFIRCHDARYPQRVRRPNPAYYPLAIEIDLKPGLYMLTTGKTKGIKKYFQVTQASIVEIPRPSYAEILI